MPAPHPTLTAPAGTGADRRADALSWLLRLAGAWFVVYLVMQGPDGFFARTADRVDALWLQATFLDVPLQLALTLVAVLIARSGRPGARRAALVPAGLVAVLVAGHVVLSVLTA